MRQDLPNQNNFSRIAGLDPLDQSQLIIIVINHLFLMDRYKFPRILLPQSRVIGFKSSRFLLHTLPFFMNMQGGKRLMNCIRQNFRE